MYIVRFLTSVGLLLTAVGLLCGGNWVESDWLYNLHPAAALGMAILYLIRPNVVQRTHNPNVVQQTHDHRLYDMFITVSRENEYRFIALLEKLQIEDPVDD